LEIWKCRFQVLKLPDFQISCMAVDLEKLKVFVARALEEDVRDGDHTSQACIDRYTSGKARLLAKGRGVLAGLEVAEAIFKMVDSDLHLIKNELGDGSMVKFDDEVFTVMGSVHSILKAERLVLNVMQRMSGIAFRTAQYVERLRGTKTKLLDTRKTAPLLRFLDKEAVRIGGGENHRFGLYDMMLVKDNHVDYAGGISNAVRRAHAYRQEKGLDLPIEVEVRGFGELDEVLACEKVDRVMFDNFGPEEVSKAVDRVGGRLVTEASGGITLATIEQYAKTGVDFVSVGELTHSVESLDLSLKAERI